MVKAKLSPQYNPDLNGLLYATWTLRQTRPLTTFKQLGGRFDFEPWQPQSHAQPLRKKDVREVKKITELLLEFHAEDQAELNQRKLAATSATGE